MTARTRSGHRGSALLLAIFFLMVTFFLAMALLELLPLELRSAGRQSAEAAAYYAADAGVQDTLSYLEDRVQKGLTPLPGGVGTYTLQGRLGDWSWRSTITADSQTPPRGANAILVYEIRAEALRNGSAFRVVTLTTRQESFAKYSWFEDQRASNLTIPGNLYPATGPFHSNARIDLTVPESHYTSTSPPIFESDVTTTESHSTPDGVSYSGSPPYDPAGNPLPERYRKIYAGGRESLHTGVERIEMPENAEKISQAALGAGNPMPTTPGVYLGLGTTSNSLAGGVVVVGDADSVTLGVDSRGNRTTAIVQGGTTTRVVEVTNTAIRDSRGRLVRVGQTLLTSGSNSSIYGGLTNGTIYGTGNIQSLQGVNKGKRTVAVDLAGQKEIVLGGNLTRADTAVGQKPSGTRDTLGLVAYKVRVPTTIATSESNPVSVYAAVFAGTKGSQGGLYIDDPGTRPPSRVRLFGGLMMAYKPTWGSVNWDGSLLTGVTLDSSYDPNLASSPPPFFPSTGRFQVMSYREESTGARF